MSDQRFDDPNMHPSPATEGGGDAPDAANGTSDAQAPGQSLSQRLAPSLPQKKAPYAKSMKRVVEGNVIRPSGEELFRPVDFPQRNRIAVIGFVIVAAIIGAFLFAQYMGNVVNGTARTQADVQAYLDRNSPLYLPVLSEKVSLDDEDLLASLQEGEYAAIIDVGGSDGDFDVIKVPEDVDASEGQALFDKGIGKLRATEAAKLLKGFWRLDVDRADGFTIRVRYADFGSGDVSSALTQCLVDQGIDGDTMTDEGEDEAGNTFKTGQVDIDGYTYQWRASAIPLNKVYDVGLPESAMYVGFRLTWIP